MLRDGDKANFRTLELAFKNNDVALMEMRRRSDGAIVAGIVAVGREPGHYNLTPFAIMVERILSDTGLAPACRVRITDVLGYGGRGRSAVVTRLSPDGETLRTRETVHYGWYHPVTDANIAIVYEIEVLSEAIRQLQDEQRTLVAKLSGRTSSDRELDRLIEANEVDNV